MNADGARALVKKHNGNKAAAAREAGMPYQTFKDRLKGRPEGAERPGAEHRTANAERKGRSLADFRAQFDKDYIVPRKIEEALRALAGGWEYEVAFAKEAGISLADLGNYRDKYADHVVVLRRDGKRAWAGTRGMAAQMRAMLT